MSRLFLRVMASRSARGNESCFVGGDDELRAVANRPQDQAVGRRGSCPVAFPGPIGIAGSALLQGFSLLFRHQENGRYWARTSGPQLVELALVKRASAAVPLTACTRQGFAGRLHR